MNIRKHIEQDEYLSWGERFPLFKPLSAAERELYEADPQKFQQQFPEIRLFPDPYLSTPVRSESGVSLKDAVIVVGSEALHKQTAKYLRERIANEFGVQLRVFSDTENLDFWTIAHPIILVGGTQHNHWSQRLAQRLQVGAFNRDFPGTGGWGITTYRGIAQGLGDRYVLAFDAATAREASDHFLSHAIANGEIPELRWIHHVQPGPNLPPEFQDFERWRQSSSRAALAAGNPRLPDEVNRPYREVFNKFLNEVRSGPIVYSAILIDLGVEAARYFQFTGDERGLYFFREMLWGFWEYLNSENADIYISDMDFRLGQVVALWSWVEHHPAITDEERRIFPQLLLGAMRIVHAYYRNMWRKETPPGTRHNHQTFKARSLAFGWRYFRQRGVRDAELWKQDADLVFEWMDASRTKFIENANSYERFAPEHLLSWHEINGGEISSEFQRALAVFAKREWALTDNFFYRVEYGDCDVSFKLKPPFQVAPRLDENDPAQQEIITLEQSTAHLFAPSLPTAIESFGRIHSAGAPTDFSKTLTQWTLIPLEQKLQQKYSLVGKEEDRFDKLAWRSGWKDDSSYLALEGFGNKTVSHAHNATNSIIRANFGGRVWLVGNGYGKRIGVTASGEAFSTRELGPVDHNMMILRAADGTPQIPPINALLVDHGTTPIPFAITELRDYAGCNWIRYCFLVADSGLIVIDALSAETELGLPENFALEWNILGDISKNASGAVADQSGVKMVYSHFDTARTTWERNASASWHRVMENGEYPHTSRPLQKCVMTPVYKASPSQYHFVSGFWIDGKIQDASWNPDTFTLSWRTRPKKSGLVKSCLSEGAYFRVMQEADSFALQFRKLFTCR